MVDRVLVVAAHPDDAEFAVGGTIALWISQGKEIFYAICTNGDKGSDDPEMTPEKLARLRRQEQKEAAEILGVREVVFLDHPDGGLEDTPSLRGELVRLLRYFRPQAVVGSDPNRRYIWHRDHRIAGRVLLDAVYPYARDRLFYPEHLQAELLPHKVQEVYLWAAEEPNFFVNITAVFERKLKAALCHRSQVRSHPDFEGLLRERAASLGKERGLPLAEAFYYQQVPF